MREIAYTAGVDLLYGRSADFLTERITYRTGIDILLGRLDDIYALVVNFRVRRTTYFETTLALRAGLMISALQDFYGMTHRLFLVCFWYSSWLLGLQFVITSTPCG